jgi:uncharacterized HhH-GPD family protein
MSLHLATTPAANALLADDPLALLVGMLLDQQIPMEKAFTSPQVLAERLGVPRLDAALIADHDAAEFEELFRRVPALHRFPAAMAKRVQELCRALVEQYDGDTASVWATAADGPDLVKRIAGLPGFGQQKAKIFTALLAKRFGVRPEGWEQATAPFSDEQPRSVADIGSAEELQQVRAWKKMMRQAGKSKQDSPA